MSPSTSYIVTIHPATVQYQHGHHNFTFMKETIMILIKYGEKAVSIPSDLLTKGAIHKQNGHIV